MKLQTPKGTRDLLPSENDKREKIYSKLREVFSSYGYGEVETPAFEYFDLLAEKSGPEVEKEIYSFEDKGGRKLGLRFDPTVPIARIVASDPSKPKPIKYYYITRMWRYDQPQAGRMREFWQAGCELIGTKEPEADAEVLKLANECLERVTDNEYIIKVNSREISEAIADEVGATEEEKSELFRSIDKLDKKTRGEVEEELKKKGIDTSKFNEMLEKIDKNEVPEEARKNLDEVMEKAVNLGVKKENIEIDMMITRGLDYYTGFVFETFIKGKEEKGSVCSGGRYDSLISIYSNSDEETPATGFGLGIDRLLEITSEDEYEYKPVDFYVCPVKEEVREKAMEITSKLREEGFKVDIDLMRRRLSKQLNYINSSNIPYALIIGPQEIENEEVTLKDMKEGTEEKISLDSLNEKLGELI